MEDAVNRPRFDYAAPDYQIPTRSEIVRQALLGTCGIIALAALCVALLLL